ncbi:hypothetical protein RQP46_004690 [Phenoliferia psychrophenolica]
MAAARPRSPPRTFMTVLPPPDRTADPKRVAKSSMLDMLSAMNGGGIAFGHRSCANRACMLSDLETVDPLRLCSKCHSVYYCSTACSVANWKKHKRACHEAVTKANEEEEGILRNPFQSEMRRHQSRFRYHSFKVEIEYTAFMAFRLAAPTNHKIQDTHFLQLDFDYDASGRTNRDKFTLVRGELVPIEIYIRACKLSGVPLGMSMQQSDLLEATKAIRNPPELVGADSEFAVVPFRCTFRDISGRVPLHQLISMECFNLDRGQNGWLDEIMCKDWLDVITRSLKGPAPRCFGELYDRTIRERLKDCDHPLTAGAFVPDFTNMDAPEGLEEHARLSMESYFMDTDFRQNMMDHRKLGLLGRQGQNRCLSYSPQLYRDQ